MRKMLLPLLMLTVGCGGVRGIKAPEIQGPDTKAVLRVSTGFGFAHACPVAEGTYAYTARHVIQRPPYGNTETLNLQWSDGNGNWGLASSKVEDISSARDLAVIRPYKKPFPGSYVVASEAPAVGAKLTILGYNYESAESFLDDKVVTAKFYREVAGLMVLSKSADQGSSGGCVLNEQGELVGIAVWGPQARNTETVGIMLALWGDHAPIPAPTDEDEATKALLRKFFGTPLGS